MTLPDGMALSPGGGDGLEGCDYDQFGVNAQGKQVNDDPPTCPAGAQIGTPLNVSTTGAARRDPLGQGLLRLQPAEAPTCPA